MTDKEREAILTELKKQLQYNPTGDPYSQQMKAIAILGIRTQIGLIDTLKKQDESNTRLQHAILALSLVATAAALHSILF